MNFKWGDIFKAIWESFKKANESHLEPIPPKPDPVVPPVPPIPVPEPKHIVIADLLLIPDRMRAQGFPGRDNLLWYALATTYMGGDWGPLEDDPESYILWPMRDKIDQWWDGEVIKVANQMKVNSGLTITIIKNDGLDRLGFRLGPATMKRLLDLGADPGRIEIGTIFI